GAGLPSGPRTASVTTRAAARRSLTGALSDSSPSSNTPAANRGSDTVRTGRSSLPRERISRPSSAVLPHRSAGVQRSPGERGTSQAAAQTATQAAGRPSGPVTRISSGSAGSSSAGGRSAASTTGSGTISSGRKPS